MSAQAREERLDALLTARLRGQSSPRVAAPDDELAPLLVAAGRLAAVSQARPSGAFAHDLEGRLLARAEHLRQHGRTTASLSRRRVPRSTLRWSAAAAAVVLLGAGTLTAAASAGPGSPLAAVSHLEEGVRLQLAQSPSDRAQVHLHYAQQALDSLRGDTSDATYLAALSQLRAEIAAARADLASAPPGSARDTLAAQLATLEANARAALFDGLPQRSWRDRLAATNVLGVVGQTVPTIAHVTISAEPDTAAGQTSDAASTADAISIMVSGSGFAPGAVLYLNGQPLGNVDATGTVLNATTTHLVASEQTLAPRAITSVGIGNPDGTVASTTALTYAGTAGNGTATSPGDQNNGQGTGTGKGTGNGTDGASATASPGSQGCGDGHGGSGDGHGQPTPGTGNGTGQGGGGTQCGSPSPTPHG